MKGVSVSKISWFIYNVWNGYTYLFYRIYKWNFETWGKNDVSEFKALYSVSFLSYINIFALFLPIASIADNKYIINYYQIIAIMIIWTYANYFAIVRNGRYKAIIKKFSNEKPEASLRNMIYCWLYVFISITSLVISAIFSAHV